MRKLIYLTIAVVLVLSVSLAGVSLDASARPLAATSPTLAALASYSVLGGQAVTCTGASSITGDVGVSPLTSISGFPSPCTVSPGSTHSNDTSAINAQAEALAIFNNSATGLDQACDLSFGSQDLTIADFSSVGGGIGSAPPGVYCSTSNFSLSGTLTLTGSGTWIFKTVSTLITSPGSSVVGGDPCNVWWRIASSTTLDTTTSFIGNVFSQNGVSAMNNGATLNGRFIALSAGTVTLNNNTISGGQCLAPPAPSATPTNTPTQTLTPGPGTPSVTPGGGGGGEGKGGNKNKGVGGLGNTGGAPIRNEGFPWSVVVVGGLLVAGVGLFSVRAYRRTNPPKR